MLFKDFIDNNSTLLKEHMYWENYGLTDVEIMVKERIQDDSLNILKRNYGKFEIDEDILDEVIVDIELYFPTLLQQLSIIKLMDSNAVVQKDILTETSTSTQKAIRDMKQNSNVTLGTKTTELNEINTSTNTTGTTKNTGTTSTDNDSTSIQDVDNLINNTSDMQMTGSRNVNLSHSMPEQAIEGETGNFPIDEQGTPKLKSSNIQNATESFSSINPVIADETSQQNSLTSTTNIGKNTTTNDLTESQNNLIENTGNTNRTSSNSGTDESTNNELENSDVETTEIIEREATNAQYAYEINAILESVNSINAFKIWVDRFSWVCGVL